MLKMESKEDKWRGAENLKEFYIDLMETPKNIIKYYFSDDVVLDWFGRTIRGRDKVTVFLKDNVIPVKHYFSQARPVEKIGFRETHVVRPPKFPRRILRSFLMSPPRPTQFVTPIKNNRPSCSSNNNNNNNEESKTRSSSRRKLFEPPAKKMKTSPDVSADNDVMESENEGSETNVRYLSTEGSIEFHRSSTKKIQPETKWQRPCKLHLAYTSGNDIRDSIIYLIIYEGNVKCRRNLLKDFEAEEAED